MKIKDFALGLASFCESRVKPTFQKTHNKIMLDAFVSLLRRNAESATAAIVSSSAWFGLVDDEGNINLDLVEGVGNDVFEKNPIVEIPLPRPPILDRLLEPCVLKFQREDFAEFIRILRGQHQTA